MATASYKDWITKDGLLMLESWARDGLTNEQIAYNIGVARQTFQRWIKNYSDIADALKRGKRPVDMEVENALLKNALGYSYSEDIVYKDESGNTRVRRVNRYSKPDTTAQIFWLKNRKPALWRDKHVQQIEDARPVKETESDFLKFLEDRRKAVNKDEPPNE